MSDEITVADEGTPANVALVGRTRGMSTNVYCELALGGERQRATIAHERFFGNVTPTMRRYVRFNGEPFLAYVTGVRSLTRVHPLVSIEAALLGEAFEAELALKGPLPGVSSHVYL